MSKFNIKSLLKSKKFPAFIKNASIFKSEEYIEKYFSKFGLNNFEQKLNKTQRLDLNKIIIKTISNDFKIDRFNLEDNINDLMCMQKYEQATEVLQFISNNKTKNKFTLKQILKIDNKLLNDKDIWSLPINAIKTYNTLSNKTYSVVFSYNPWDIATMSMRGIKSCQSWDSDMKSHLIGSIYDPCCGIIYLKCNQKNKYGSLMLARSVVRLVKSGKNSLFTIEDPYFFSEENQHNDYYDRYVEEELQYSNTVSSFVRTLFSTSIEQNRKNKNITVSKKINFKYKIDDNNKCESLKDSQLSYIDSGIRYIWQ